MDTEIPSDDGSQRRSELPLPTLTGTGRPSSKLREALQMFTSDLSLFSRIVLTVWLPGNLLVNYLSYHVFGPEDVLRPMRVTMWIEGLFGPVYIGALIYALSQRKQGHDVGYAEAMRQGLRSWVHLFAARLIAGLYIFLGVIALIIPGIVLAVRYALLDFCVVLEGAAPGQARSRSMKLTEGRRWPIFLAGVIFLVGYMAVSVALYLPLSFFEPLNNMFVGTVIDSLLSVLYALLDCILFVFYWEARQGERRTDAAAPLDPL